MGVTTDGNISVCDEPSDESSDERRPRGIVVKELKEELIEGTGDADALVGKKRVSVVCDFHSF